MREETEDQKRKRQRRNQRKAGKHERAMTAEARLALELQAAEDKRNERMISRIERNSRTMVMEKDTHAFRGTYKDNRRKRPD